jgi:transposase InsO family protein
LEVSRSSYYAFHQGLTYQASWEDQILLKEVKDTFDKHLKRYGSRRILEELKDRDFEIGLFKVRSLMKAQNLKAIQPKSFVPRTTQSNPNLLRSPNLLLDLPFPDAPNKVVVGDITYLPAIIDGYEDWLYLAVWMDLFSRKIAGWEVDEHMDESLVIWPFKEVIRDRQPAPGMIVHSDGGGQYASINFRALLAQHGFRQSMTRKDDHYDNAFAESLFSRFKAELLDGGVFYGLHDARTRIFEYIEGYYNTIRKHSSLGYISPVQFEDRYWIDYWRKNRP